MLSEDLISIAIFFVIFGAFLGKDFPRSNADWVMGRDISLYTEGHLKVIFKWLLASYRTGLFTIFLSVALIRAGANFDLLNKMSLFSLGIGIVFYFFALIYDAARRR